jgi:TnpA family transposase
MEKFTRFVFRSLKNIFLNQLSIKEFESKTEMKIRAEIRFALRSQTRHRQIFGSIADRLVKEQILLPSYNTLASLIDEEVKRYDRDIEAKLKDCLSEQDITEFEKLLTKVESDESRKTEGYGEIEEEVDETKPENTPYILTELKRFNQSNRPSKVRKNLESLVILQTLFKKLEPAREVINFTDEGIKYYAALTIKQKLYQIIRKSSEARLIYFYCFVNHQYYRLNDTLADTITMSASSFTGQVKRAVENYYFETKSQNDLILKQAYESRKKQSVSYQTMRAIIKDSSLNPEQKLSRLNSLIDEAERCLISAETIEIIEETRNHNEFHFMEKLSKTLILKVSKIIKKLEFNSHQTDNPELLEAIDHYCKTNGEVGIKPPLEFLSSLQRRKLKKGKDFKKSLYKVFLFLAVADNLKAGRLNLKYSYRFRSAQEYMLQAQDFTENMDKYLEMAELKQKQNFETVGQILTNKSNEVYINTNRAIMHGQNTLIRFDDKGDFILETPKISDSNTKLSDLLPKEQYISLIEIMYTVARSTKFWDYFENLQQRGNKVKVDKEVLLATIFALGCNIGISKAAKITNLNESDLEYARKWFLSVENLKEANEKVVETISKLELPNIYKQADGRLYTSSDGQKIINNTETLNANYSYKYGLAAKASVNYTHIDMRHILFHSTVISASEREAIYVVDGLLHSKWIKSDIHSTDTFGSTEAVFGLCYLLGFDLVPRIKDLNEQTLYSIAPKYEYESKKYKLLPDRKVNLDLIQGEWNDLLRLATSIKLGICSGSQILKRLNSYSRKNNLYLALRELGRLVKSLTILTYINDLKLRQTVEKLLNIVEHSNRFSKVVRFGNGGEMYIKEKEDQDIAESCKRLQENSIILHNYYYLTNLLQVQTDEQEKLRMLKIIRLGSPISWVHINFFGKYNFKEEDNQDSLDLNLSKIQSFKLADYLDKLNNN